MSVYDEIDLSASEKSTFITHGKKPPVRQKFRPMSFNHIKCISIAEFSGGAEDHTWRMHEDRELTCERPWLGLLCRLRESNLYRSRTSSSHPARSKGR